MNSSLIAMGLAGILVAILVIHVGLISLLVGAFDFLFGKPKYRILKSHKGPHGFAFAFHWNGAKEPARMDSVKIRLFNPHGRPSQAEVHSVFSGQSSSFAEDVDLGPGYINLLGAQNFEQGMVTLEIASSTDGVNFTFEMPALKFKRQLVNAAQTAEQYIKEHFSSQDSTSPISIPARDFIADTVPGKGPQLAIATNPTFAAAFAPAGGGAAAAGAAEQVRENFVVSKVWIEPGCIVCNACEDIHPEVFDVQADTCYIRPGAPLEDGLRIEEAAEACPVEVIKFNKA